jgi:hypothetical protein
MQAIYLGTQQEKTHDGDDADSGHTSDQYKLFNLYNDFGFLLYSMCCPPMNMEAFKTKLERPAMNEDGSKVTIKHREPTQRDGYKLSLIMFSKALMQPMPEQAVWRLFLMIGKCYGKLQRPPAVSENQPHCDCRADIYNSSVTIIGGIDLVQAISCSL